MKQRQKVNISIAIVIGLIIGGMILIAGYASQKSITPCSNCYDFNGKERHWNEFKY